MANDTPPTDHAGCCEAWTRRDFVRTLGAGVLGASVPNLAAVTSAADANPVKDRPSPSDLAETAVARFYKSLTKSQRETICFPFDHSLRTVVKNNWSIVKPTIRDLDKEQQALCREIMKNLTSEEGYERFMRQMKDDAGGFDAYHVAVFGQPEDARPFEWVLTGRHDTLRVDGDSVIGSAFGGPIFYGHAAGTDFEDAKHTGNVWWPQAEQANKVFSTLDDKQRKQALQEVAEDDDYETVRLKGEGLDQSGLLIGTLDGQQKDMTRKLIETMLVNFRECDAAEVRRCLEASGGVDKLRLTFFQEDDIGADGVWDIWKLEGPAFSWYFRGAPHVHTWLNVAHTA
ncbi:DUF3500 domain-containing protein [Planctomyces sp. SH-PL62]|uniref:DUF3500 domain-containing protein n=1 Tax=Planctomyces sp. SH-PL62 TaxID=1636152 RepID=UPI00078E259E|nr:DUF3500 domain-containing protein [Planctomyces sp. SH-PL62]AMV39193.1 hypothetical protein VT85_17280 [Planctomyces sp. SH-PL62]